MTKSQIKEFNYSSCRTKTIEKIVHQNQHKRVENNSTKNINNRLKMYGTELNIILLNIPVTATDLPCRHTYLIYIKMNKTQTIARRDIEKK